MCTSMSAAAADYPAIVMAGCGAASAAQPGAGGVAPKHQLGWALCARGGEGPASAGRDVPGSADLVVGCRRAELGTAGALGRRARRGPEPAGAGRAGAGVLPPAGPRRNRAAMRGPAAGGIRVLALRATAEREPPTRSRARTAAGIAATGKVAAAGPPASAAAQPTGRAKLAQRRHGSPSGTSRPSRRPPPPGSAGVDVARGQPVPQGLRRRGSTKLDLARRPREPPGRAPSAGGAPPVIFATTSAREIQVPALTAGDHVRFPPPAGPRRPGQAARRWAASRARWRWARTHSSTSATAGPRASTAPRSISSARRAPVRDFWRPGNDLKTCQQVFGVRPGRCVVPRSPPPRRCRAPRRWRPSAELGRGRVGAGAGCVAPG